jgi:hypothetical protein
MTTDGIFRRFQSTLEIFPRIDPLQEDTMKFPKTSLTLTCLLLGLTAIALAQKNDPEARITVAGATAHLAAHAPMNVNRFQPARLTIGSSVVLDAATGMPVGNAGSGESNLTSKATTTPSLVPIATFDGSFVAQGGPDAGGLFPFTMIGGSPEAGGTTTIPTRTTSVCGSSRPRGER